MFENRENEDNYVKFVIGVDDTDSVDNMCTTYLGSLLTFHLLSNFPKVRLTDFPYLIRHNPNIPYKTRGNGSIVIHGKVHPSLISWLFSSCINIFDKYREPDAKNINPGFVLLIGTVPLKIRNLSKRALWDVIEIDELYEFLTSKNVYYKGHGRKLGLIGALAGIGTDFHQSDYTFELLIYRNPPFTKKRNENQNSVWNSKVNSPYLFNCVDEKNRVIKIFPKGSDPVFCGIRGEFPEILLEYWESIQPQPAYQFFMIFKSNQGTDAHIKTTPISSITDKNFLPHRIVNILGTIKSSVKAEKGGHFHFTIKNENSTVECYAYEPTKDFRQKISYLIEDDILFLSGAIRPESETYPISINLERILIVKLTDNRKYANPLCEKCGKRMESAGKNQPFRCKICKTTKEKTSREIHVIPRKLKENQVLLPDIDAQRHLTKPLSRYNFNEKELLMKKEKINIPLWLEKIYTQNEINFKKIKLTW